MNKKQRKNLKQQLQCLELRQLVALANQKVGTRVSEARNMGKDALVELLLPVEGVLKAKIV